MILCDIISKYDNIANTNLCNFEPYRRCVQHIVTMIFVFESLDWSLDFLHYLIIWNRIFKNKYLRFLSKLAVPEDNILKKIERRVTVTEIFLVRINFTTACLVLFLAITTSIASRVDIKVTYKYMCRSRST